MWEGKRAPRPLCHCVLDTLGSRLNVCMDFSLTQRTARVSPDAFNYLQERDQENGRRSLLSLEVNEAAPCRHFPIVLLCGVTLTCSHEGPRDTGCCPPTQAIPPSKGNEPQVTLGSHFSALPGPSWPLTALGVSVLR